MSAQKRVHLGYVVGSGDGVEIPLRHLAVTGQTQEAGKTTTLEALISRSALRAVTFITKRGEGSFTGARRIAPYFREQTDWVFVSSLLEASRGEKLKFERAWIIRASKGARTLADVHANVRAALSKAKGISESVYTVLDAYLEVVVPIIGSVKWAPGVELSPGVNVMDLGDLAVEMQHLVIRSTLNWVLEREHETVVVVPEAWKFIPQGRGTPVKLAAEAYIRQGAALGNYLWLDSQDLGGIEKGILRSVPVWLLGVQREANEIKRTLDNIPAGVHKPKPADVATLGLGQFFACWGSHVVKTYVQPAWMPPVDARQRALDLVEIAPLASTRTTRTTRTTPTDLAPARPSPRVRPIGELPPDPARSVSTRITEDPAMCEEHKKLQVEIEALRETLKHSQRALESTRDTLDGVVRERNEAFARCRVVDGRSDAASDLVRSLSHLLRLEGWAAPSAAAVDAEAVVAIVRRELASSPGRGGPVTPVTPPEKLRHDFQQQEVDRLLAEVNGLKPLARRVLKLLEAVEGGYIFQKEIATRLGRAPGGGSWIDLTTQVKELVGLGLVEVDPKKGARSSVRAKITAALALYQPAPADVEAVYQNVLHAIATVVEG